MNENVISLETTINECLKNPEFIKEYKRLSGAKLVGGSPIENAIDIASGFYEHELIELFDFIKKYVWLPYILQIKKQ
jgi:hypothetical protein